MPFGRRLGSDPREQCLTADSLGDTMTGTMWGADVAQLRHLAQDFGRASDTLLQQSAQLSQQINNNPAWTGNDTVRFTSQWNSGHRALLMQTASRLKAESKKLLEHAEQQEQASNAAAAGAAAPGPKSFMDVHKQLKDPFTIAKHASQYGWVLQNEKAAFVASFQCGFHREGGPALRHSRLGINYELEALLKDSTNSSRTLNIIDKATDYVSLKNLHEAPGLSRLPFIGKLEWLLAEKPLAFAGGNLEWLGKSGLARGLGWAGVGFSAYDAYKGFASGDVTGGAVNAGKAALGVFCFAPPPVGTVAQVASVGIMIYENREAIGNAARGVGEGMAKAIQDPGKFVNDSAKAIDDAGKSVANFLGFGR